MCLWWTPICLYLREPGQTRGVGETGGKVPGGGVSHGVWNGVCNKLYEYTSTGWQGETDVFLRFCHLFLQDIFSQYLTSTIWFFVSFSILFMLSQHFLSSFSPLFVSSLSYWNTFSRCYMTVKLVLLYLLIYVVFSNYEVDFPSDTLICSAQNTLSLNRSVPYHHTITSH